MSKRRIDLLPLIPGRDGHQNAARPIREAFQSILDGELYPKKVAEYVITSKMDKDLAIKENAEQVLQIYDSLHDIVEVIDTAGREIMEQHGHYMIKKDCIGNIQDVKERMRLQHCYLFRNIRIFFVDYFGLLQKYDLLPDMVRKYLDYRINEKLHLCKSCVTKLQKLDETAAEDDEPREVASENVRPVRLKRSAQKGEKEIIRDSIIITPNYLKFRNCEPGKTYKKTVKLLNTSPGTQVIAVKDFPKYNTISVIMDLKGKMASGMSCSATIIYKPEIYRNLHDTVSFRNRSGFVKHLPITAVRDPPKLITCIFKSNSCHLDRPKPGSPRFLETRREALNSSIDCGSCMVGEYIYLSVFVQNNGTKGKFFIITEDEWYFENVETITKCMEHSGDSLWIYPTFFELNTSEIIHIHILFYPFRKDMYLEKFYFICDNNTSQQFEVLGDGMLFSRNFVKIDALPSDVDIDKKEDYCIFLGNLQPNSSIPLVLIVHNTSSLHLKCYWWIQYTRIADIKEIDQAWIEMENFPNVLAPYSTTDFKFTINLKTSKEGFYNTFFKYAMSFFIGEVPLTGLDKYEKFLVHEVKKTKKMLTKCVDVHITHIEVACSIEKPKADESTASSKTNPTVPQQITPPREPRVGFSTPILQFGILPNGIAVQKQFFVENYSIEPTKWKIVEVKYNVDYPPFMEVVKSENISCDSGSFYCICKKKEIFYSVKEKGPKSWVSMLLLISMDKDILFEIESICIVTYAIINYDITINGSDAPLVCPMNILFIRVPHILTITIENHSPIPGIFYFLKPYGDTSSIQIEIHPPNDTLKAMGSRSVDLKITGNDVGIFENIYIPCVINKNQYIVMRLLCAVDTIHLAMYLPGKNNYYKKTMWPPKIVFEYDDNWMICPCTLEYDPGVEAGEMPTTTSDMNAKPSFEKFKPGDNTPIVSHEIVAPSEGNVTNAKTDSKPSSDSQSKTSSESFGENLADTLRENFGEELFLQNSIVEVHEVQLRTPTTVTFFIENITPVETSYTVEAVNFFSTKSYDKLAEELKFKKAEDIWNGMIENEYGILVIPNVKEGYLTSFGLVEVNLTIFANTWGIYQEEIAVDVSDVSCFTFSLLIKVVGCPILFPLALTKVTEVPSIRCGTLAYCSEEIRRKIRIVNTSCVPFKVMWHVFMRTSTISDSDTKFNIIIDIPTNDDTLDVTKISLTEGCYGKESNNLLRVLPYETILEQNSGDFLDIVVTPENFPSRVEKTFVRSTILGTIFLENHHQRKTNYFFRHSNHVNLELHCTLELPTLTADFVYGETAMRFYANDVIFSQNYRESVKLVFHNSHSCAADVEMAIKDPLEILGGENGAGGKHFYLVQPLSTLEITVSCNINHQHILLLSELVYPKKDADLSELNKELDVHAVDKDLKIVHIKRDFRIVQKGGTEQVFPIELFIHFPYISVRPNIIMYDQVFLGNSRKTLVTVFNNTGCPINFEIYKSLASEVLFITPHYGRIEGSTGVNKSFFNIFIYFTPREARPYQESIRIVTNIPNYFVDVIIKANGTLNEKFQIDYKI